MTPAEVSDDMLMALADGEMSGADAIALHARILRDPALAERFAVFAETRAALQAALDPGPVPERLVAAVLNTPMGEASGPAPAAAAAQQAKVLAFRPRRMARVSAGWMALAASLLLAVGIGGFQLGRTMVPDAGGAGALAALQAVAGVPTGGDAALPGGGAVRVLASFDTDAGFCRLVTADDGAGRSDRIVACRKDAGWRVMLSVAADDAGAFVTASHGAVEMVDALLDRIGAGPALDPAEELRRLQD